MNSILKTMRLRQAFSSIQYSFCLYFFIIDLHVNILKALENIYADDTTVYESSSNIWNLANDLFAELGSIWQ